MNRWMIFDSIGWKAAGGLIAIAAVFFSLDTFVDTRISYKLRDPEVVRQIAYLIRPSLIFDQHGNYEIDNGAGKFIGELTVERDSKGYVKVIMTPRESLNIQPLLRCLNGTVYFSAFRQKSSWVFQEVGPTYLSVKSDAKQPDKYLFELEIVR